MNRINPSELQNRRLYTLQSRNLVVGVWNAEKNGFIGIREKFGDLFLFTEYEYDYEGPYGTAIAVSDLEVIVPDNIPLQEYLGTVGQMSKRPVEFRRDNPPAAMGKWYYTDDDSVSTEIPTSVHNTELFDFLKPYDDAQAQVIAENWNNQH